MILGNAQAVMLLGVIQINRTFVSEQDMNAGLIEFDKIAKEALDEIRQNVCPFSSSISQKIFDEEIDKLFDTSTEQRCAND